MGGGIGIGQVGQLQLREIVAQIEDAVFPFGDLVRRMYQALIV